jgi:hypothetical protein
VALNRMCRWGRCMTFLSALCHCKEGKCKSTTTPMAAWTSYSFSPVGTSLTKCSMRHRYKMQCSFSSSSVGAAR